MAPLSPLAEITARSFHQTCTVYTYSGSDYSGQPYYSEGTTYPCRIAIRTKRHFSDEGDYIANQQAVLLLPADCPVQAQDKVDLPDPYQRGAIIDQVATGTDWLGRVTHKVVRIA